MLDAVLLFLVARMDSPSFRQREAAHATLARLKEIALSAVERGMDADSAEVRARCRQLLSIDQWKRAYRKAGGYRALMPWIDSVSHQWGWDVISIPNYTDYLTEARQTRWPTEKWGEYREATRLWVAAQIVQRRPKAEIDRTLDILANQEDHWRYSHPEPMREPRP